MEIIFTKTYILYKIFLGGHRNRQTLQPTTLKKESKEKSKRKPNKPPKLMLLMVLQI